MLIGALLFIALLLIGPRQISLIDAWGDRWLSAYLESHNKPFRVLTKSIRKGQTDQAINYLQKKELVGVPTETVYGLAGNAYSSKAVKKIYF